MILGDLTNPQLNTPFHYPDGERAKTVEVTDPTHPLFGRTFRVVTYSTLGDAQYVLVVYREQMLLRIPLSATTLRPAQRRVSTKLTLAAVQELLSVAEEVVCPLSPETSGKTYPPNAKSKSRRNSPPLSRR